MRLDGLTSKAKICPYVWDSRFIQVNKDIVPSTYDTSRFIAGGGPIGNNNNRGGNISSYYGALKIPIASQYGQLDSIQQVVATNCEQKFTKANLPYTNFGNMCGINDFTPATNTPEPKEDNSSVESIEFSPTIFSI